MAGTNTAGSSVGDFLYYESFLAPQYIRFSSYQYDLRGGVEARQDGMVVASAKSAVWDGALLYLMTQRVVGQRVSPGPGLRALFAATVADDALIAEFDGLLLQNPSSHEDVAAFAGACVEFVMERLGLRALHQHYGGLSSPELYARYHQRLLDLGEMARDLDIALPRPVESVMEGIRIRKELERKLASQAVSARGDA